MSAKLSITAAQTAQTVKGTVNKLAALVRRLTRALTGVGTPLTPAQKARLDAMEREYQELVRAKARETTSDFPRNQ